jgi:DNA-directed RNA polymerase subunit M/transcription elongation factor TFIIS
MKLIEARFCPDCNEVFCNKGNKLVEFNVCPSCTNRLTLGLMNTFVVQRDKRRRGHGGRG